MTDLAPVYAVELDPGHYVARSDYGHPTPDAPRLWVQKHGAASACLTHQVQGWSRARVVAFQLVPLPMERISPLGKILEPQEPM